MAHRQEDGSEDDAEATIEADEHAEAAASMLELVTRPGIERELAVLLAGPVDPDAVDVTSSDAERDPREAIVFAGWVGRSNLGEPLAEACRLLGHMATWRALALLEKPTERIPTASLDAKIGRYRVASDVLRELFGKAEPVIAASADGRQARIEGPPAALLLAGRIVQGELAKMEEIRSARVEHSNAIGEASVDDRGARGTYSGPARLRRFLKATCLLSAARWTQRQFAELIVDSGGWKHPPCRTFVADLVDDAGGVRQRAVELLVGRLRDAERRAGVGRAVPRGVPTMPLAASTSDDVPRESRRSRRQQPVADARGGRRLRKGASRYAGRRATMR